MLLLSHVPASSLSCTHWTVRSKAISFAADRAFAPATSRLARDAVEFLAIAPHSRAAAFLHGLQIDLSLPPDPVLEKSEEGLSLPHALHVSRRLGFSKRE